MYKFTCIEWFEIKGRGGVASVNETLPDDLWHPDQLNGCRVLINDEEFTVKGVERYMIGGISPEHPYRMRISILV